MPEALPVSRHNALRPFTRDHFVGLFHAHRLKLASKGHPSLKPLPVLKAFKKSWEDQLSAHLDDEERTFSELPLNPESIEKLLNNHGRLRVCVQVLLSSYAAEVDLELMDQVASMLHEYIRWEERVFFPEVEATLTDGQVRQLEQSTEQIEATRLRNGIHFRNEFNLFWGMFMSEL